MADLSHEITCTEILYKIHKEMHSNEVGYHMEAFDSSNGGTCIVLVVNVDNVCTDKIYDSIKNTVLAEINKYYPQSVN